MIEHEKTKSYQISLWDSEVITWRIFFFYSNCSFNAVFRSIFSEGETIEFCTKRSPVRLSGFPPPLFLSDLIFNSLKNTLDRKILNFLLQVSAYYYTFFFPFLRDRTDECLLGGGKCQKNKIKGGVDKHFFFALEWANLFLSMDLL